jgi:lysophospholipase L1-like esterase
VLGRILACVLATGIVASVAPGATLLPADPVPRGYYLALGDSLAYGLQPAKLDSPPSASHTGYVDVFAARLRTQAPKIHVVNYGCPGETTSTFAKGGCPWLPLRRLHQAFQGSQMSAALAFLSAHRGRVSPITVSLGGNDLGQFADSCRGSWACVQARAPRATVAFAARLDSILRRLRAAAPQADIIVTGLWDDDVNELTRNTPIYRTLNQAIARTAARSGAHFADMLPLFNPAGSVAKEKARICALTFRCSEADGHPTNAGYQAMAAAILAASGLARRS